MYGKFSAVCMFGIIGIWEHDNGFFTCLKAQTLLFGSTQVLYYGCYHLQHFFPRLDMNQLITPTQMQCQGTNLKNPTMVSSPASRRKILIPGSNRVSHYGLYCLPILLAWIGYESADNSCCKCSVEFGAHHGIHHAFDNRWIWNNLYWFTSGFGLWAVLIAQTHIRW